MENEKRTILIASAIGTLPVIWIALMTAPFMEGGLVGMLSGLTESMGEPMKITWCKDSLRAIIIFLLIYAMGIGIYPPEGTIGGVRSMALPAGEPRVNLTVSMRIRIISITRFLLTTCVSA